MQKLTNAEEEIMQIIWKLERCTVSDIIGTMKGEKPPHSTVSSTVRILEKKGFVDHKAYGRTYEYFYIISKEKYSKKTLSSLVKNYFGGSMNQMVSFLVQEEKLSKEELNDLVKQIKNQKQ